jgi:hypothetical protein
MSGLLRCRAGCVCRTIHYSSSQQQPNLCLSITPGTAYTFNSAQLTWPLVMLPVHSAKSLVCNSTAVPLITIFACCCGMPILGCSVCCCCDRLQWLPQCADQEPGPAGTQQVCSRVWGLNSAGITMTVLLVRDGTAQPVHDSIQKATGVQQGLGFGICNNDRLAGL